MAAGLADREWSLEEWISFPTVPYNQDTNPYCCPTVYLIHPFRDVSSSPRA
jgi:hypothetical protein